MMMTSYLLSDGCYLSLATCYLLLATCYLLPVSCYMLLTDCNLILYIWSSVIWSLLFLAKELIPFAPVVRLALVVFFFFSVFSIVIVSHGMNVKSKNRFFAVPQNLGVDFLCEYGKPIILTFRLSLSGLLAILGPNFPTGKIVYSILHKRCSLEMSKI